MTLALLENVSEIASLPVNLRDLGGIPIDGGHLQQGLAIRTDDLAYVTDECATQLVANGLKSIIDLRSAAEVSLTGRGPLGRLNVSYHHIPLMADIAQATKDSGGHDFSHEAMGRSYVAMVEKAAPQLVMALNIVAYSPGSTAFHCAAGRDRTGVLAAMLLLALGAEEANIVADYSKTGPNMHAIMDRAAPVMGAMWKALGYDPQSMGTNKLAEGDMSVSMTYLLGELRDRHGDPLAPLRAAGLSDDTVAHLRKRALGA